MPLDEEKLAIAKKIRSELVLVKKSRSKKKPKAVSKPKAISKPKAVSQPKPVSQLTELRRYLNALKGLHREIEELFK